MSTFRVNNITELGGEVCAPWQANHSYSLGARCVCTRAYGTVAARAVVFECTTAGTSHATTEPTWDYTVGNTTADGADTLVWTARSPSDGEWDNASCFLDYITNHAAAAAGGDTILVHKAHAESNGGNLTLNTATTQETPLLIYCVDKDDSDALDVGASFTASGYIIFNSGALYSYGVEYRATTEYIQLGGWTRPGHYVFESNGSTVFKPGWGNVRVFGNNDIFNVAEFRNLGVDQTTRAYGLQIDGGGFLYWVGGEFKAHVSLATLFSVYGSDGPARLEGVDLSTLPETCEILPVHATEGWYHGYHRTCQLVGCKLPATFAGTYENPPPRFFNYYPFWRPKIHQCANGNTIHDFLEQNGQGTCEDETTVVRTGGASNGTTAHAIKMTSTDKCAEGFAALISPEIAGWTASTTSKTFTIEGIIDSETNLQDDEIWMELVYPANNANPLRAAATDRVAPLGTPADQAASEEEWGDGGLSNPNKFKLSVTVTPGKAGPIAARVYLAKPSTIVYIDPRITES